MEIVFFGVETVEWQRDRDVLRVCGHLFFFSADIVFCGKGGRGCVEIVFRCAGSEACGVGFSMCIQWSVNENRVLPGDRLLEGDVGHLFLGRHSRCGLGSGLGRTKRLALAGLCCEG